ncbi:MAG: uridine kinase [Bryobacterales bacterium]|nr:uridine kinase [Bryobacterales bacterium]
MVPESVTVILIAGMSGSGKSELAAALRHTRDDAAVLHLDGYYLPLTHLSWEERARMNFDHPGALDWPLMREHLAELKAGRAVEAPVYNFALHNRELYTHTLRPGSVVIAEGLLGLHDPLLRALADLTVYVETPPEECLRRRMARDIAERGRTETSVREQWEHTVWPMAREYILPSRRWASITVSGEQAVEETSAAVLRELELAHS